MLQILRFMALQNTLFKAGDPRWNATTLESATSSTQPSVNEKIVLVNIFWFASLIISLVSASFGMLVKQWLREYLAVNNPSPRARVRILHDRRPELSSWRVFEIASMLPLLLQLALALFFVGLCIFTSSLGVSISWTTAVLVCGWALCFITASALPAFFPRCPYKTALLNKVLRLAYHWIPSFIKSHSDSEEKHVARNESRDLEILVTIDALQEDDEFLRTTISDSITQIIPRPPFHAIATFVKQVINTRKGIRTHEAEDQAWSTLR